MGRSVEEQEPAGAARLIRARCGAGGERAGGGGRRGKSPWPGHIICRDLDGSCAEVAIVWGRERRGGERGRAQEAYGGREGEGRQAGPGGPRNRTVCKCWSSLACL